MPHPICPQCKRRHARTILEVRLFQVNRDGGTETVTCFRPDEIVEALAALAEAWGAKDPDWGPVGYGLDVWIVDSQTGDADPIEEIGNVPVRWLAIAGGRGG